MLQVTITNRAAIAVLLVGMLSACTAQELRRGQDYFSEAAAIENRALFASFAADNPDAGPGDAIAALSKYRLAEASLRTQIEEDADDLKADKLYGTTYVLLAMAQWRISDLEGNALSDNEAPSPDVCTKENPTEEEQKMCRALTAEMQPTESKEQRRQTLLATINTITANKNNWTLGTRDRVLSHALYGFYDHDGGRMAAEYDKAKTWFKSALARFDEAFENNNVPANHPVRVYIAMAKLRTLASWLVASFASGLTPEGDIKDVKEINESTKRTACSARSFYSRVDTEIQDRLEPRFEALLAAIGQSMPTENDCKTLQPR